MTFTVGNLFQGYQLDKQFLLLLWHPSHFHFILLLILYNIYLLPYKNGE